MSLVVFHLVLHVSRQLVKELMIKMCPLVGPLFGGFSYYYFGKTVTFLMLAAVALIDGCKMSND